MPISKTGSLGSVAIIGNNPPLAEIISRSFSENNINTLTPDELKNQYADYCIFIHNLSAPHSAGQLNDLLKFLNSENYQNSKFALIFQHTNLTEESSSNPYLQVVSEVIESKKIDYRILHVYDLISSSNGKISPLDNFIKTSFDRQQVSISNNGIIKLFPLAFDDFFKGLSRSLFIQKTSSQSYYFGGQLTSDIDFSITLKNIFRKHDLDLDINQDLSLATPSIDVQSQIDNTSSRLNWIPQIEIDDYINTIFSGRNTQENKSSVSINLSKEGKNKNISKLKLDKETFPQDGSIKTFDYFSVIKIVSLVISSGLVVYLIMLATFLGFLYLAGKYTDTAFYGLQKGDIKQASTSVKRSNLALTISHTSFSLVSSSIAVVFPKDLSTIDSLYLLINHTNSSFQRLGNIYVLSQSFFQDSLSGNQSDTPTISTSIASELESFRTELNQLSLLKDSFNSHKLFGIVAIKLPKNFNPSDFSRLKSQVSSALSLIRIIPSAFPDNETRKYLFLFQDNNEYRPTGGHINTYALLTFQGNRLTDSKIDAAIHLNSSFQGTITPPPELLNLTGNATWNFSDSNFSPNFPESASQSAWLFEKNTGIKSDGVVSVNLSFFENLLKYYGPIKISGGRDVSSANLRLVLSNPTQETSEDTLTEITKQLFVDIKSNKVSFSALARSIFETISNSDISLWFTNSNTQKLVDATVLSGILKPTPCPPQFINDNCLAETFSFNESNYSINKSNFYEVRNINHTASIALNGDISHQITVDYSYPILSPSLPTNQIYKSLIRLYVPLDSVLNSITLDSQPVSANQVSYSEKNGLLELTFPLSFTLNQDHQLKINISSPSRFAVANSLSSYSLTLIKQPGIFNTNQTVNLIYPNILKPQTLSLPATVNNELLAFPKASLSNSTYAVSFSSSNY